MDNAFGIMPETPATADSQVDDRKTDQTRGEPGSDGPHTTAPEGSTPSPATTSDPAPEAPAPAPATTDDDEARAFEAADGEDGVRLGNKVYKDWAAADHVFRTFAGKASAEAKRRRELEERLEKLEKERDELRAGSSTPAPEREVRAAEEPTAPTPTPSRKRLKEVLTRDEVNRMIVDDGIDAVIERLSDLVDERIEQTATETFAPLKPLADRKVGTEMAIAAFDAQANRTTKDGSYVFPELDPEQPSSDAIVQIWQRRVMEDETFRERAFDPLAIEACVLEYRSGVTSTAPQAEPPTPAGRADAAALQGMGRLASPSPAAPGPTRRFVVDPEETIRRLTAARSDNPFGVEREVAQRR